jgi:pilus assembly protein Flp/PilA
MTEYFVRLVNFMTMPRDEEKGATAVEYGLMVALIAAVIVAAVYTLGGEVKSGFDTVNTELAKPPAP